MERGVLRGGPEIGVVGIWDAVVVIQIEGIGGAGKLHVIGEVVEIGIDEVFADAEELARGLAAIVEGRLQPWK